jgi:hypothetical protein
MRSRELWKAFLDTGAPELCVLYSKAKEAEADYVFNNSGSCVAGHQLQ